MSKNTRWALAMVGVAIIIVGAVLIGTGKDNTDAEQDDKPEVTVGTGATQSSPAAPTGATGSGGDGGSGAGDGAGDGSGNGTGGASPSDAAPDSGGASPGNSGDESGGAEAQIGVVSPILSDGRTRTIKADKGELVTIRATATSEGEMHVHGYDKVVELKPGEIVRVKFRATIDGEFPIEFHLANGAHADVGTLRVSP